MSALALARRYIAGRRVMFSLVARVASRLKGVRVLLGFASLGRSRVVKLRRRRRRVLASSFSAPARCSRRAFLEASLCSAVFLARLAI